MKKKLLFILLIFVLPQSCLIPFYSFNWSVSNIEELKNSENGCRYTSNQIQVFSIKEKSLGEKECDCITNKILAKYPSYNDFKNKENSEEYVPFFYGVRNECDMSKTIPSPTALIISN